MDDLRLTPVRVIEGSQDISHNRNLLVESERQRALLHVLA